jgi:4-hydroxybenzoate polyprenyltransferase
MKSLPIPKKLVITQIGHFIIHLRWHYQVLILSGGFLLGGYFSIGINWPSFLLQFANVHLLLFGGATAYNSYWDRDRGPVGGLKNPPPVHSWMWAASIILQLAGFYIATLAGWIFSLVYLTSMFFFWLYSTPHFRWKAAPVRSLLAIGISTGTASLLLGYLSAGNTAFSPTVWIAAFGTSLILVSLYPVSQLYQLGRDCLKGDHTFALTYGFKGVIYFFRAAYVSGLLITGACLFLTKWWAGLIFISMGGITGVFIYQKLSASKPWLVDYSKVMRIKYATALAFEGFILLLILIKQIV